MKRGHLSRTYSLHITHEIVDRINNRKNQSCLVQWASLFHWNQVYKRKAPCDQEEEEEEEEENPLPYDMLAQIFTRLPANQVLCCRSAGVCRAIYPFITSSSFDDMHLSRATPIIAFQYYTYPQIYVPPEKVTCKVSIDFTCENTMMTTTTAKQHIKIDLRFASPFRSCMPFLYGSHNGFLLFKNLYSGSILFIWNPITHEKLTLDTGSVWHTPCAFYFHPNSREHRVLVSYFKSADTKLFGFIVVSLRTKLSRVVTTASFSHPPLLKKNPIILNGALHWPVDGVNYKKINGIQLHYSNCILAFNMDTEEVQTISHPGYQCDRSQNNSHIQIIDMEGKLCYCDYNPILCTEISLWILEDYEKQVWVKRHVVDTDPMKNLSFTGTRKYRERRLYGYNMEVVHMYGDELLINMFHRNLFLFNLQLGTFRRAGKQRFSSLIHPVAHINTLVSLCKMDGRHT